MSAWNLPKLTKPETTLKETKKFKMQKLDSENIRIAHEKRRDALLKQFKLPKKSI